eukprot:461142-Pelagomonas_calceolata.AAC.3
MGSNDSSDIGLMIKSWLQQQQFQIKQGVVRGVPDAQTTKRLLNGRYASQHHQGGEIRHKVKTLHALAVLLWWCFC